MSTGLLLISDTHVPRRARGLPQQVWDAMEAADVVVHAGDWVDVALLRVVEQRARRLIGGHSHIPWDTTTPAGLRLLNPGSPTDRRRQPACTYLTAEVAGGALGAVVRHPLPPRTPRDARCPADARHSSDRSVPLGRRY